MIPAGQHEIDCVLCALHRDRPSLHAILGDAVQVSDASGDGFANDSLDDSTKECVADTVHDYGRRYILIVVMLQQPQSYCQSMLLERAGAGETEPKYLQEYS